jgi:hypothetical protein
MAPSRTIHSHSVVWEGAAQKPGVHPTPMAQTVGPSVAPEQRQEVVPRTDQHHPPCPSARPRKRNYRKLWASFDEAEDGPREFLPSGTQHVVPFDGGRWRIRSRRLISLGVRPGGGGGAVPGFTLPEAMNGSILAVVSLVTFSSLCEPASARTRRGRWGGLRQAGARRRRCKASRASLMTVQATMTWWLASMLTRKF